MKKILPICMCLFLAMSGCANIQNDRARTTTEGALVGAGAGAGLGALIGHFAGSAGTGALIGTLVGTAIGAGVGDHIADKKEAYATREKWLNACIANAQHTNYALAEYSERLRAQIRELNRRSKQLAQAYRQQQISRAELRREKRAFENAKREVDGYIISAENEARKQRGVITEARRTNNVQQAQRLEYEISQLEKQIRQLERESQRIGNISQRIPI